MTIKKEQNKKAGNKSTSKKIEAGKSVSKNAATGNESVSKKIEAGKSVSKKGKAGKERLKESATQSNIFNPKKKNK